MKKLPTKKNLEKKKRLNRNIDNFIWILMKYKNNILFNFNIKI